jgi:hypothetical protein
VINERGNWIGGFTTVVQLGDQIDGKRDGNEVLSRLHRCPELEVLQYTEKLHNDARQVGGNFFSLLGNHELMNTQKTFYTEKFTDGETEAQSNHERYVTAADNSCFNDTRQIAFAARTGLIATKVFAARPVAIQINKFVFSHADVGNLAVDDTNFMLKRVRRQSLHTKFTLETLNDTVHTYLTTGRNSEDKLIFDDNGPLWNRKICDGAMKLENGVTLTFVAGHTTVETISQPIAGAWCTDTAMSRAFHTELNYTYMAKSLRIEGINTLPAPAVSVVTREARIQLPTHELRVCVSKFFPGTYLESLGEFKVPDHTSVDVGLSACPFLRDEIPTLILGRHVTLTAQHPHIFVTPLFETKSTTDFNTYTDLAVNTKLDTNTFLTLPCGDNFRGDSLVIACTFQWVPMRTAEVERGRGSGITQAQSGLGGVGSRGTVSHTWAATGGGAGAGTGWGAGASGVQDRDRVRAPGSRMVESWGAGAGAGAGTGTGTWIGTSGGARDFSLVKPGEGASSTGASAGNAVTMAAAWNPTLNLKIQGTGETGPQVWHLKRPQNIGGSEDYSCREGGWAHSTATASAPAPAGAGATVANIWGAHYPGGGAAGDVQIGVNRNGAGSGVQNRASRSVELWQGAGAGAGTGAGTGAAAVSGAGAGASGVQDRAPRSVELREGAGAGASTVPTWDTINKSWYKQPRDYLEVLKAREVLPPVTNRTDDVHGRVVAFGDVHGDIDALLATLYAARVVNVQGEWIGDTTTVVQLGDQIDRQRFTNPEAVFKNKKGESRCPELEVLQYTEWLHTEAQKTHGNFFSLLGNHEIGSTVANTSLFDYASDVDCQCFERMLELPETNEIKLRGKGRQQQFTPGSGKIAAKVFAARPVVIQIGEFVFSHADVGTFARTNSDFEFVEGSETRMTLDELNQFVFTYLRNTSTGDNDRTITLNYDHFTTPVRPSAVSQSPFTLSVNELKTAVAAYVSAYTSNQPSTTTMIVFPAPVKNMIGIGQDMGPLWNRDICKDESYNHVDALTRTPVPRGVSLKFIAGHSVQYSGITEEMPGAWCVDTGRSLAFNPGENAAEYYKKRAQSLQIDGIKEPNPTVTLISPDGASSPRVTHDDGKPLEVTAMLVTGQTRKLIESFHVPANNYKKIGRVARPGYPVDLPEFLFELDLQKGWVFVFALLDSLKIRNENSVSDLPPYKNQVIRNPEKVTLYVNTLSGARVEYTFKWVEVVQ